MEQDDQRGGRWNRFIDRPSQDYADFVRSARVYSRLGHPGRGPVRWFPASLALACAFPATGTAQSGITNSSPAAQTRPLKRYQQVSTNSPPLGPTFLDPDPRGFPVLPSPYAPPPLSLELVPAQSTTPPLRPSAFPGDPGHAPVVPRYSTQLPNLQLETTTSGVALPPPNFNPDPGAQTRPASVQEQFRPRLAPAYGFDPLSQDPSGLLRTESLQGAPEQMEAVEWPRVPLRQNELRVLPISEHETVPPELELPRQNAIYNEPIPTKFHAPSYPLSGKGQGLPPHTEPQLNRWKVPFVPWTRYATDPSTETPYQNATPHLWHPYETSIFKGDVPVIGQDIFLNLTATSLTEFEARRLPTPRGISGARADNAEFFGMGEQFFVQNTFAFGVDLFKGETAFKPVQWAVRLQPAYNVNYIYARETGVVSPDPRGRGADDSGTLPDFSLFPNPINPSDIEDLLRENLERARSSLAGERHTTRLSDHFALQEAFLEVHLADLSDNYDFITMRAGNQPFVSDFRGFIFNDVNTAFRLFGNARNNHYQYNVALFDQREKDTNSDLNSFDERNQRILIANLYRQDFLWKGYTAQLSFHANFDDSDLHYDQNGFLVRPAPLGTIRPHHVRAYYFGWNGDGHIGRLNLTHSFYQAIGRDDFNGLAGQEVDINARMAAVELSYDRDWIRYKVSCFYASGDDDVTDDEGTGFDTILDNPAFVGGPFSYYVRQGFNLGGTLVNLKQRSSLVPNLRTSKTQGQANFVNPGLFLAGVGSDLDLTPKLRSFVNINYVRLMATDPIQSALLADEIDHELGWDFSLGVQYRPLLTDNIIINAGFGALLPGAGFKDIYRRTTDPVPGFTSSSRAGQVDGFLYSALLTINFTY